LEDSTIVKFEIWDTAGQERYIFGTVNMFGITNMSLTSQHSSRSVVRRFLIVYYAHVIHLLCKHMHFFPPQSRNCKLVNFRYAALAPLYYRGAAAAIVVYDITSPESFNKAQYWVKVNYEQLSSLLSLCLVSIIILLVWIINGLTWILSSVI